MNDQTPRILDPDQLLSYFLQDPFLTVEEAERLVSLVLSGERTPPSPDDGREDYSVNLSC